jgi:hypothetical protein
MSAITAKDFEAEIPRQWRTAEISGLADVLSRAGDLHSSVDSILLEPPKGKGASLCIRYRIPRPAAGTTANEDESRVGRDSNTERGSAFQEIAEVALGKMLCVTFQREAPVLLGDPPRKRKFDLP